MVDSSMEVVVAIKVDIRVVGLVDNQVVIQVAILVGTRANRK